MADQRPPSFHASADEEKAASARVESVERPEADESPPLHAHDDVPDGGTMAWLQVFGSYFVFMDTWCDLLCYVINRALS